MKILVIIAFLLTSSVQIVAQNHKQKCNTVQEKSQEVTDREKTPYFVQFGIMSKAHKKFEENYGVDIHYQNCVVSKFLSEKAKENNKLVAKTLTQKFGNAWKKDLGFLPYGL
ncbi:FEKKY domain-containing protein [Chryseobacterium chendengshani]|uniref:FEKKY domain-containing protein n=1 Tax=Chryseobacterium sp. LJ756 TaxID=2864113 RepID=UPI001C63D5CD|nr:hypothetical protein [Chryseobacterium sp. LJ756]MBW7675870.1 hypothetical protein [Chryseobacterium sp. LJ756]